MDELTLLLREVARSVFELALLTVYVHNSIVLILLMHDFKCRSCMLPLLFSGALIAIESDFLNSKWLCSMPSVSVAIRSCDLFQGPYLFVTNCLINLVVRISPCMLKRYLNKHRNFPWKHLNWKACLLANIWKGFYQHNATSYSIHCTLY